MLKKQVLNGEIAVIRLRKKRAKKSTRPKIQRIATLILLLSKPLTNLRQNQRQPLKLVLELTLVPKLQVYFADFPNLLFDSCD